MDSLNDLPEEIRALVHISGVVVIPGGKYLWCIRPSAAHINVIRWIQDREYIYPHASYEQWNRTIQKLLTRCAAR